MQGVVVVVCRLLELKYLPIPHTRHQAPKLPWHTGWVLGAAPA